MNNSFRRRATVLAFIASTLALTGCSALRAQPGGGPELTNADIAFLSETRNADIDYTSAGNSTDLVTVGRRVCTSLNSGTTLPAIVKSLSSERYPDWGSAVAIAAIRSYCPQQAAPLKLPGRN